MDDAIDSLLEMTADHAARRITEETANDPDRALRLAVVLRDRMATDARTAPERALHARALAEAAAGNCEGRLLLLAQIRRVAGQAYRAAGRHSEAVAVFERAADAAIEAGDATLAAQVRLGAIDSLAMLGSFDAAFDLAGRLRETLEAAGAQRDAAMATFNLGAVLLRQDRYTEALASFERSADLLTRDDAPAIFGRVRGNCALALTYLGRVDEALTAYEEARAAFESASLACEAAVVDTDVAFLHTLSGSYVEALPLLLRAGAVFRADGRALEAARNAIDIGDLYRVLNLYAEALEQLASALVTLSLLGDDYDAGRALLTRAATLISARRTAEAIEDLERAEGIFRRQRNAVQRGHVRLVRAALRLTEGDKTAARREAAGAQRIFLAAGAADWTFEARVLVAEIDMRDGIDRTRSLNRALRLGPAHLRRRLCGRIHHAIGRFRRARGENELALISLRAAVGALEQARATMAPEAIHVAFLRDKVDLYEDLVGLLLERGGEADIVEALERVESAKSRALLERLQLTLGANRPNTAPDPDLGRRIDRLRAELNRIYRTMADLGGPSARLAAYRELDSESVERLETEYASLLRQSETGRPAPRSPRADVTAGETLAASLRQQVGDDRTLVEYYVLGDEICAFIVNRHGIRVRRDIARMSRVEHEARRLRRQLQRAEPGSLSASYAPCLEREMDSVLSALYGLLLRPIESELLTTKLVVIPFGALHALPFHALRDGVACALDRWEILYAPSAAIWAMPVRGGPRASRSLIMGAPGPGIERIGEEVARLAERIEGSELYCGEAATVSAFRNAAGNCRIMHLAMHGMYRQDNPLFSGLRFADDWLLARDLYEIPLQCELATLSACMTGAQQIDAGDEPFGLIRAFLSAGADAVAASLWPADDAATSELMERFYSGIEAGAAPAAALRAAQRNLRGAFPHPYYWAPFFVVGKSGAEIR